ncbi:hypothetical protein C7I84_10795 [Mesorhizobium ephedrae]|uniref:Uncharacterized protein n=1 Tax=Kumtagia ephedrae TaxID=2116701 RepID=A0A2P7SDB0_9HYPH|nr:hypothetical protein C7I84_10795 [Mesorhizobium ephedrae]
MSIHRAAVRHVDDERLWLTLEAFERRGRYPLTLESFLRERWPPQPATDGAHVAVPVGVWEGIRLWRLFRSGRSLGYLGTDNAVGIGAQADDALAFAGRLS